MKRVFAIFKNILGICQEKEVLWKECYEKLTELSPQQMNNDQVSNSLHQEIYNKLSNECLIRVH